MRWPELPKGSKQIAGREDYCQTQPESHMTHLRRRLCTGHAYIAARLPVQVRFFANRDEV